MSHIPRTNPGASWWAISTLFALLARLSLFVLLPYDNTWLTLAVYSTFNILEKPFLLTGVVRFLNQTNSVKWVWAAAVTVELLLGFIWFIDAPTWLYRCCFALFNVTALSYTAWVLYRNRAEVVGHWMLVGAVISFLAALHWASVYIVMYYFPAWNVLGFLLGTVLVMILYFIFLASVLLTLQNRLLQAEEKALALAYHDPLTGLKNKLYMSHLFEHAVLLANRPHQLMAVFYIDLDDFKPINDTEGHKAGDMVLKTLAERMKTCMRSTDICARLGGDEFVIVATQLEREEQVHEVAQKILGQLMRNIPIKNKHYELGASIGVSIYPQHSANLSRLIEMADQVMYEVKREGKSGYKIFKAAPAQ